MKPLPWRQIVPLVWNTDGKTHPTVGGVFKCVKEWRLRKATRGRKKGWRKTSARDDAVILATFHKVRPPGQGVTSTRVSDSLPRPLRNTICKRTIRNRLADKGYYPEEKCGKTPLGAEVVTKRMAFCRDHEHRSAAQWSNFLHGVGDFKSYSYYPHRLKLKFFRYSAKWTYMNAAEKRKPEFAKPSLRTFTKNERKTVLKGKVFGLTVSTGAQLIAHVETPFTSKDFAKLVREKIGPFFTKEFPDKSSYQLLLDGEPLLHAPEAKEALREVGIRVLPSWPPYSPDLNPQENVWPWVDAELRRTECRKDSFGVFRGRITRALAKYPNAEKLIASMEDRISDCLATKCKITHR